MITLPRLVIVSVFATAPLAAQFSQTVKLDTDAGVFAIAKGRVDFDSSPKGTMVPTSGWGFRLSTRVTNGSGGKALNAMQTLWAGVRHDNGGSMGVSGLARGSAQERAHLTPSQKRNGAKGPVGFVATMKGPANRKGVIRLTWQTLFKRKATGAATVDVGNDGSVEWKGGDTKGGIKTADVPAAFDGKGNLSLRITLAGEVTGAGGFDYSTLYTRLTWKFIEPRSATCKITPFGKGCHGVKATGAVASFPNHHVLTVKVTGGFKNGHVLETVGTKSMNLPLPGGCSLLNNALVILIHKTDAKGEFSNAHKVSKFSSAQAYHQFLPIAVQNGGLLLRSSNGLRIECRSAR